MNKLQPVIDRFNALDIKARYAAFVAAMIVVILLDYFLLLRPQLGWLNKAGEAVKATSADVARVKEGMQRINEVKKGLEATRQQLQALDSKIRKINEVPAVLDEIAAVANESRVVIDQILPSRQGPQVLATAPFVKYYSLPIVVAAHSGYHMFGRFLNKLESANLLFTLKELRLNENAGSNGLEIQATLEIILAEKFNK